MKTTADGMLSYFFAMGDAGRLASSIPDGYEVQFGGPNGPDIEIKAGDAAVLPAGTARKLIDSSPDFALAGAYPPDQHPDMCYGKPGERPGADERIARVPRPDMDPVSVTESEGTCMRVVSTVICAAMFTCTAMAESGTVPSIEESAQAAFAGRPGAVVVIDCSSEVVSVFGPDAAAEKLAPCSTFKIWNALIGLECGILSSADQAFYTWDGQTRAIPAWNRDLSLKEAFQVSCVPAFQDLARKIGAERMQSWIDKVGYGNRNTSAGIDVFWLPAPGRQTILISPQEQARLMYRLARGQVPFSAQSQSVLRELMTVLTTEHGTLYGKTGSSGAGTNENPAIGWFVGYVESGGGKYAFACCVRGEGASGKAARDIVETVLQRQGWLPSGTSRRTAARGSTSSRDSHACGRDTPARARSSLPRPY